MKYAQLGSVIRGTLRNEDLLPAFTDALMELVGDDPRPYALRAIAEAQAVDHGSDEAHEVLYALVESLQEYAPEGVYFGSHSGDESDFGFWPCEEHEKSVERLGIGVDRTGQDRPGEGEGSGQQQDWREAPVVA